MNMSNVKGVSYRDKYTENCHPALHSHAALQSCSVFQLINWFYSPQLCCFASLPLPSSNLVSSCSGELFSTLINPLHTTLPDTKQLKDKTGD